MLKSFTTIRIIIVLSLVCSFRAWGQQGVTPKMEQQMRKAEKEYKARSENEKKLLFGSYELLRLAEAADSSAQKKEELNTLFKSKGALKRDNKGRVEVKIGVKPSSAVPSVITLVKSLGGDIIFSRNYTGNISCKIKLKALRKLIEHPNIYSIDVSSPDENFFKVFH